MVQNHQYLLKQNPRGEEMIQQQNQSLCTEGLNKVAEFIAGAELYMIKKQTKMAAFMLHQAAEQALHTLFHIHTGMYLNTHSIDKPVRYCSLVCYQLPGIFPRNNEKDEHLFQLLQKAYVGGRYKLEYEIDMMDLELIIVQIKKLIGLIQL